MLGKIGRGTDGTGGSFGTWIVTEGDKQTETEDFRETEKIILIIFLFLVLKLGILIVAAVGIIGFLLTAGIAFGIAGSYQID